MRKRIVSLFLCLGIVFNVSFANTEAPSAFNTENLELFKSLIHDLFYEEVTDQELYEAALKGMFQSLDPYSNYYNAEESTEFNTDVSGSYSGVGIKFDGYNNYIGFSATADIGNKRDRFGDRDLLVTASFH